MDARLFSLTAVRQQHLKSIPAKHRRTYMGMAWGLPAVTAAAVLFGVLDVTATDGIGLASGIITFAALIFALAIQLFSMSASLNIATDAASRADNLHTADLIRQLLATVIMITAYGGAAFVAPILAGSLGDGSWPQRIASATALGLLAHVLVLTALALRRTYDFVDQLLRRQLRDPVP